MFLYRENGCRISGVQSEETRYSTITVEVGGRGEGRGEGEGEVKGEGRGMEGREGMEGGN